MKELAYFFAKFSMSVGEDISHARILLVDGASNMKGSDVGIELEGPDDLLIEQSLNFEFKSSNNSFVYEGIIIGMSLVTTPF